jgi:hypothetical protein
MIWLSFKTNFKIEDWGPFNGCKKVMEKACMYKMYNPRQTVVVK